MHVQSEDGTTPLIDAVQSNQLESCKLLLKYGGTFCSPFFQNHYCHFCMWHLIIPAKMGQNVFSLSNPIFLSFTFTHYSTRMEILLCDRLHQREVTCWMSYRLNIWGILARNFFLHHSILTGSEVHPAFCAVGTRGSPSPGVKVAVPCSWLLTSI
jgi:hypothetical protein